MSNELSPDKGHYRISKGVELCLSCGFCCNGVLFSFVPLKTDEAELASQLGLSLYPKKADFDAIYLPCSCFKDNKCSVYDAQQPRICEKYQCKLLKGYLQGTISFGESMELVRKAKGMMEAIYQNLGDVDPSKSIWKQIRDFMELQARSENSEESRRITARLLLDVKKLSIICNHFGDGFFR
jgi:Fe-S-cluster containining protein